jgi:hypothetical protein
MSRPPRQQAAALEKLASSPAGLTTRDLTHLAGGGNPRARLTNAAALVRVLLCKGWAADSGERRKPPDGPYRVRVWVITGRGREELEAEQARAGGAS